LEEWIEGDIDKRAWGKVGRNKEEEGVGREEAVEDEKNYYQIIEYVDGQKLFDKLLAQGPYMERDAIRVVRQVLSALLYIHSNGIAHRDIKPENILSTGEGENEIVKLTGFGFSKSFVSQILNTQVGSPWYVASEVIEGKEHDKSVDMWSLGVIVYILLCGDPPFYSDKQSELINQILRCEYSLDMEDITAEGKDFL